MSVKLCLVLAAVAAQLQLTETARAARPDPADTATRDLGARDTTGGAPSIYGYGARDPLRVNYPDYKVNRSTRVQALRVANPAQRQMEGQWISLYKGDVLTVMDETVDPVHGRVMRIGLDSVEGGRVVPSDFVVKAEELDLAALSSFDTSSWSEEETEAWTSVHEWLETMVAGTTARVKATGCRGTCCYHHVKNYLLSEGQLNFRPGGGHARMAANELDDAGMTRGGCSPTNPVKYCTCVYTGGSSGHVETYRGDGCWWYGHGCKKPMTKQPLGTSGQRRLSVCFR